VVLLPSSQEIVPVFWCISLGDELGVLLPHPRVLGILGVNGNFRRLSCTFLEFSQLNQLKLNQLKRTRNCAQRLNEQEAEKAKKSSENQKKKSGFLDKVETSSFESDFMNQANDLSRSQVYLSS
jgi:hypothetical protein